MTTMKTTRTRRRRQETAPSKSSTPSQPAAQSTSGAKTEGDAESSPSSEGSWPKLLKRWIKETAADNPVVFGMLIYGVLRAAATTVKTGTTGLFFSFGRVKRVVEPGLCYTIPFLQVVRTMPTRSRTMDLPAQRVATLDGLVYSVDVNLVYRIVDIHRAMIEVDDLGRAMGQVLGLSVQEILRVRSRGELGVSAELDRVLAERMGERLEPWGVVVESAGFTSIRPTAETLRLTQLALGARQRCRVAGDMARGGVHGRLAPAMAGFSRRYVRRAVGAQRAESHRRLERRMLREAREALAEETKPDEGRLRYKVVQRARRLIKQGRLSESSTVPVRAPSTT